VYPMRRDCSSLRTTVPKAVVEFLGLKSGDVVEWTFQREFGNVHLQQAGLAVSMKKGV